MIGRIAAFAFKDYRALATRNRHHKWMHLSLRHLLCDLDHLSALLAGHTEISTERSKLSVWVVPSWPPNSISYNSNTANTFQIRFAATPEKSFAHFYYCLLPHYGSNTPASSKN
ncbi:hypothetical protein CANCADRAFT_45192 [Tortispora caseinolytica NRRL Y-17796]|uniref:Uncharacterized protein n=1 Tax=Tortispora caseinolytica NRRL Y-17796 TaxID=767744 RepID=A0A1E4TAB2_9ASCO|nr:hypothetical protein CANCADRAFT_45192 [Tortispora caseinolytica NRRL Y-17796]